MMNDSDWGLLWKKTYDEYLEKIHSVPVPMRKPYNISEWVEKTLGYVFEQSSYDSDLDRDVPRNSYSHLTIEGMRRVIAMIDSLLSENNKKPE